MGGFWLRHPKLKTGLAYAAKNAINALVTAIPADAFAPNKFSFSSLPGVVHLLILAGTLIFTREAIIFVPKLLAWSQT